MKKLFAVCVLVLLCSGCSLPTPQREGVTIPSSGTTVIIPSKPYEIGTIDTAFQRVGPDHKIEVWAVPDPKVSWVTCFYSRARTGGIKWGLGLAEDTSDASVACRQTGPISFVKAIEEKEEIRNESTSLLFKKIRIVRFYDKQSNSLIYLVYSDKLIDGSPKNSISAVALENVKVMIE